MVATRDVSVQAVTQRGDQENSDGSEAFPFQRRAALNALAIINRHRDESRNHQNPNDSDFVGRGHGGQQTSKRHLKLQDNFPGAVSFALHTTMTK
jgi:hypothetical protein